MYIVCVIYQTAFLSPELNIEGGKTVFMAIATYLHAFVHLPVCPHPGLLWILSLSKSVRGSIQWCWMATVLDRLMWESDSDIMWNWGEPTQRAKVVIK